MVDGVMYLTQSPNDILAVDAKTGRVFWVYHYATAPESRPCCGIVNRGVAILGDTLFMATVDAHLELAAAFKRLPALIGMMLLSGASVVLGIILLVAPGIFLLVCYSVLMPLVLF